MSIFSLNSYKDLLQKCRNEIDFLFACSSHPEYDFTLFNIVVGMNHLYEWFLKENEISEDIKLQCILKFNPYSNLNEVSGDFKPLYGKVEFPEPNEYQQIIRKLCNKAKHFKKQKIEDQGKNYTSVCGAEHMQCGNPEAVCGGFDHYLYSVDVEGEDIRLDILLLSQIEKWEKFIDGIV